MVTKVTAHIFYKYSKREEWGAMCAKSTWRHIDQQYWVLLLLLCCPKNTQECLCYKVFVFFGFLIFWCFNYYSIKMACGSSSSETFTIIFIAIILQKKERSPVEKTHNSVGRSLVGSASRQLLAKNLWRSAEFLSLSWGSIRSKGI